MRAYKLIVLNRKLVHKWKPEGIYNSWFVKNLVNKFIRSGNIGRSEKLVYGAFKMFKFAYGYSPVEVFVLIVEQFKLRLGLKIYRRGQNNILVPKILPLSQSIRFSVWNIRKLVVTLGSDVVPSSNKLELSLFNFMSEYMAGRIDFFSTKRLIYRVSLRNRKYLHFRW